LDAIVKQSAAVHNDGQRYVTLAKAKGNTLHLHNAYTIYQPHPTLEALYNLRTILYERHGNVGG